jgi:hypothetical protein
MATGGCASSGPLTIVPRPSPAITADPTLLHLRKTHRVEVRLLTATYSTRTAELPSFEVSVTNDGPTPLSFSARNVAVFSEAKPVGIYTASELIDRIQKEAEKEAHERSGASAEKILQAPSTRNDPSAAIAMIERDKAIDQSAATRAASTAKFAELVKSIVPVSISPGGTGSGIIKLHAEDIRTGQPLRIVVTIANESYEFLFDVGRGTRSAGADTSGARS